MPKPLKYHQNGTQDPSKIDEKSRLRRGCVLGSIPHLDADPFGDHFPLKIKKWHPKRHPKIDAEQVSKINAKRIEHETKIDAKINDFSYFFEKGENARNHCIYKLKRGSGHVKSSEKSM